MPAQTPCRQPEGATNGHSEDTEGISSLLESGGKDDAKPTNGARHSAGSPKTSPSALAESKSKLSFAGQLVQSPLVKCVVT